MAHLANPAGWSCCIWAIRVSESGSINILLQQILSGGGGAGQGVHFHHPSIALSFSGPHNTPAAGGTHLKCPDTFGCKTKRSISHPVSPYPSFDHIKTLDARLCTFPSDRLRRLVLWSHVGRAEQWTTHFPYISVVATINLSLYLSLRLLYLRLQKSLQPQSPYGLRTDQGQRVGFNPHRGIRDPMSDWTRQITVPPKTWEPSPFLS